MREVGPAGPPRLLVIGCGGIGGVLAANLVEQGHSPTCVTRRPEISEALRLRGFDLSDELGRRRVRGSFTCTESLPEEGAFDYIFLAVPPTALEAAGKQAASLLAPGGALVCLQNGLAEERLARLVGAERVIGAVVAWGASCQEPGVFERTSSGGFTLGRLDGELTPALERLGRILEPVGPVELSTNLSGARWSKLAINCAVSSLGTIGGDRLGVLMRHRFVRRLALEVMTEVVHVARAAGVRLEKVAGTIDLEWIALTEEERTSPGSPALLAKHGVLLAVGARYRRLRSSMLAAIERGREPPVDYLNGEVVERAARLGLQAPVNERIREMVHAIARRDLRSDLALLRRLHEETQALRELPHLEL